MPLPDSPQTREEMYLSGIATGSTDGLPDAPVTREEMYLDYIARNGGGGGGGGGGGSSTLSGLTDVDISNPANGQTLVFNAESGKWENGAGGGDVFETFGTFSVANIPMEFDSEQNVWLGTIVTDLETENNSGVRNFHVTFDGTDYVFPPFADGDVLTVDEDTNLFVGVSPGSDPVQIMVGVEHSNHEQGGEPHLTNVSGEYYGVSDELAILLSGGGK